MHDRIGSEALPVPAFLAFEALFVLFPIVMRATTMRADNSLFDAILFPTLLAALLGREAFHKFDKFHACVFVKFDAKLMQQGDITRHKLNFSAFTTANLAYL